KVSVNPLASRNRSAAKDTPLIAWRMALCIVRNTGGDGLMQDFRQAAPRSRYPPRIKSGAGFFRRRCSRGSALVATTLEGLLRRPGPELRDVLVGLDRNVGEHRAQDRVVDLLNAGHVDVLHRVVVVVELELATRGFDRDAPHRLEEGRGV